MRFSHTLDDDSANVISAPIPLTYDTIYRYYGYAANHISFVSASFSCEDNSSYYVNFPGVGSGEFSGAKALVLSSSNVCDLKPGTVYRRDPSGNNEFLWVSHDSYLTTTQYQCVPGEDKNDHRHNRLSGIVHSVKFRDASIKSIQMTLKLDTLLSTSQRPQIAKIDAIIDFGKGKLAVFNGSVDYLLNTVHGIYAEGGKEYEYKYDYEKDNFSSEPLN